MVKSIIFIVITSIMLVIIIILIIPLKKNMIGMKEIYSCLPIEVITIKMMLLTIITLPCNYNHKY